MRHALSVLVAAIIFAAGPAVAGIADSPLPVLLPGATTLHLYSVPGVVKSSTRLATFFSCTSTDTATMQVGVEVFGTAGGASGNDPVGTSLSVVAGGTVTFGTAAAVGIAVDSVVSGPTRGSARILATSKKLACTAFIADVANDPPTSMVFLTIIAKTKQKAAN